MDQQSFFCGVEHSEVDEALFGFLDDSYRLPFDTIFQTDMDSLMVSSSPANDEEGLDNFYLPPPERIHEQPAPLTEQSSSFYPFLDPAMAVAATAGGGGGLFERSSFFYPFVDPAMAVAATAGSGGGCCMSAQSAAARQRRKRISERTQELGRLIPGGMTMNTAPMLLAAFNYLEFLKAQYAILRLMESFPDCKSVKDGDLHALVASPAIQQRLSEEGMCVVPTEMVDEVATGIEFKSEPLISSPMDPFISEPLIPISMDPIISEPLISDSKDHFIAEPLISSSMDSFIFEPLISDSMDSFIQSFLTEDTKCFSDI